MPQLSMHSPAGAITISQEAEVIVAVDWGWARDQDPTTLLREAVAQLHAYFDGTRTTFDLPIEPQGSEYQRRVWRALVGIPYGRTVSYGQLATATGGSARSVGQASGRNPVPLFIPCHRVVGARSVGGFSAEGGIDLKRFLLQLERAPSMGLEAL